MQVRAMRGSRAATSGRNRPWSRLLTWLSAGLAVAMATGYVTYAVLRSVSAPARHPAQTTLTLTATPEELVPGRAASLGQTSPGSVSRTQSSVDRTTVTPSATPTSAPVVPTSETASGTTSRTATPSRPRPPAVHPLLSAAHWRAALHLPGTPTMATTRTTGTLTGSCDISLGLATTADTLVRAGDRLVGREILLDLPDADVARHALANLGDRMDRCATARPIPAQDSLWRVSSGGDKHLVAAAAAGDLLVVLEIRSGGIAGARELIAEATATATAR